MSDKEILQEWFNKAYIGVVKQGKPSRRKGFSVCLYRGPDGLKCGVGHIIPDDKYFEEMDSLNGNTTISAMILAHPIKMADALGIDKITLEGKRFLTELQQAHDDTKVLDFVGAYKKAMSLVAIEYNLTIPERV